MRQKILPLLILTLILGLNLMAQGSGSKSKAEDVDPAASFGHIDAKGVATLKDSVPVIILDARGPQKKAIRGAIPMDVSSSPEDIAKAVPSKDALVITYCWHSQCVMAGQLAHKLHRLGYTHVLVFTQGIQGWQEAHEKTQSTKE